MLSPLTSTLSCSSPQQVVRVASSAWGWTTQQTQRHCHDSGVSVQQQQQLSKAAGWCWSEADLCAGRYDGVRGRRCLPVGCLLRGVEGASAAHDQQHECLATCSNHATAAPATLCRAACETVSCYCMFVLCRAAEWPPSSRRRSSSRQQKAQGVSSHIARTDQLLHHTPNLSSICVYHLYYSTYIQQKSSLPCFSATPVEQLTALPQPLGVSHVLIT